MAKIYYRISDDRTALIYRLDPQVSSEIKLISEKYTGWMFGSNFALAFKFSSAANKDKYIISEEEAFMELL